MNLGKSCFIDKKYTGANPENIVSGFCLLSDPRWFYVVTEIDIKCPLTQNDK